MIRMISHGVMTSDGRIRLRQPCFLLQLSTSSLHPFRWSFSFLRYYDLFCFSPSNRSVSSTFSLSCTPLLGIPPLATGLFHLPPLMCSSVVTRIDPLHADNHPSLHRWICIFFFINGHVSIHKLLDIWTFFFNQASPWIPITPFFVDWPAHCNTSAMAAHCNSGCFFSH